MTKIKATKQAELEVLQAEENDTEQEIIEVSQDELKKALKVLLTQQNDVLASLYEKHAEYNKEFFEGKLSLPIITIEKMNNRTLGNYTYAGHTLKLENHIKLNVNFVALNPMERVLETLKHEMIHQWQDEVLYAKPGEEPKEGQKKFPKERHNKDFKDMAEKVGIRADGTKCTGNPANMPEPKSYNRKFICGCEASNGYPLTIWSTREVHAECTMCGNMFVEVLKKDPKAETIEIKLSHVEKLNEDAVYEASKDKYKNFKRFETKNLKEAYIEDLPDELGEHVLTELEQGAYQKNHNAYKWGYRYWVAFNTDEIVPDAILTVHDDTHVELPKAEEPDEVEPMPEPKKKKERKKITPKPDNVVKFPVKEPKADVTGDEAMELLYPSEVEPPDAQNDPQERVWNVNNPQDLIDAYKLTGTQRKAAELMGVAQSSFSNHGKKFKIDWAAGTFEV